jgi:hypothetical protein
MATYTMQIPGDKLSDERKTALPEAIKDRVREDNRYAPQPHVSNGA